MKLIECQQYAIAFERPWHYLNALLTEKQYSKIFVLVDDNTDRYCLPILKKNLEHEYTSIVIKSGEVNKSIKTCEAIWSYLMDNGCDRHSVMLNLGGGVIGDMGGFCASTYMRGIDFVQIPTTLLSQVDASVGGKLGIDLQGHKNLVGVFVEPQAVIIHVPFLKTLSDRELRSGYAEVIKHALIKDAGMWQELKAISNLRSFEFQDLVYRNVLIKKAVVDEDPYEKGLRKILNFGHTVGHAVETEFLESDSALLHGEAIAIGMMCESWMAHQLGHLSRPQVNEIHDYLKQIYDDLPAKIPSHSQVIRIMQKDKKNKAGHILASLLTDIGACAYDVQLDQDLIKAGLTNYPAYTL